MEKQRLFFGIPLSENVRAELASEIHVLKARPVPASLRLVWASPENLHVTLKFLGGTDPGQIAQILGQARTALKEFHPFEVSIEGLGGFPNLDSPQILWAGVNVASENIIRIAKSLDGALVPLGFRSENRPFHPHVTLARVKEGKGLRKILEPIPNHDFGTCRVDQVILFESHTPSHAPVKYEPLFRIQLSEPAHGP